MATSDTEIPSTGLEGKKDTPLPGYGMMAGAAIVALSHALHSRDVMVCGETIFLVSGLAFGIYTSIVGARFDAFVRRPSTFRAFALICLVTILVSEGVF